MYELRQIFVEPFFLIITKPENCFCNLSASLNGLREPVVFLMFCYLWLLPQLSPIIVPFYIGQFSQISHVSFMSWWNICIRQLALKVLWMHSNASMLMFRTKCVPLGRSRGSTPRAAPTRRTWARTWPQPRAWPTWSLSASVSFRSGLVIYLQQRLIAYALFLNDWLVGTET